MMRLLRGLLPKTLFGRALLIVVLPTVLVQLVATYIFYERHWDNITRHMANALAGEIAFMAYQATSTAPRNRESLEWIMEHTTGLSTSFQPRAKLAPETAGERNEFVDFRQVLRSRLDLPFAVRRVEGGDVQISLQFPDGVMSFRTTAKRLESSTTIIFVLWMVGASLVFLCIALLFLRNQIRPIRQLADAAESFGKGQDIVDFKPRGAQEVRQAARAFLIMRERIVRQVRTRTDMLAGISHDLRTPLTRMKLQLALLGDAAEARELTDDVTQMEHMIAEYLDFARGDSAEESVRVSLAALLEEISADYRRGGHDVPLAVERDSELSLRAHAFRRMMHNLIDNALRYGQRCRVSTQAYGSRVEIRVDDEGPGIPAAQREEVFRPFTRLDESRNPKTGGVGLGLTIARDIARSHGGNIRFGEAPGGGFRVIVQLPL